MKKTELSMICKIAIIAATAWIASPVIGASENRAEFLWMQYEGSNPAEDAVPLLQGEFRNPILPGFQPDPSIVRVGQDFYVVNSFFGWFPGIPIFHSRDLVN